MRQDEVVARLALYWRGRLTHADLAGFLAKSQRQAATLMKEWFGGRALSDAERATLLPPALQGLRLDPRQGHVLSDQGAGTGAALFPQAPAHVRVPSVASLMAIGAGLQQLHQMAGGVDSDAFAPFGLPVHDEGFLDNGQEQQTLHALCMAGGRNEAVDLTYVSKAGVRLYVFSPLRVIRFPDRIRVRGYAQSQDALPVFPNGGLEEYIDIVPSRVVKVRPLHLTRQAPPEGDVEWSRFGEVHACFHSGLTPEERDAFREEYGDVLSEDGEGVVLTPVREAVAFYAIRGLRARRIASQKPVFAPDSCVFVKD